MPDHYIRLGRLGRALVAIGMTAMLLTAMASDAGSLTAVQVLGLAAAEGLAMGAGAVLKE